MVRYTILLAFLCTMTITAFAQIPKPDMGDSWKKRLKTARQLEESGEFSSAAEYYKSVLTDKPTKFDIAHKAGMNYLKVRDYLNATAVLKNIKDQNATFDKIGYKYALALKQSGRYDEAATEFELFLGSYTGSDADQVARQVEKEMTGCNMALSLERKDDMVIDYLTEAINTPAQEFAPIPFTNEVLYYSSDFEGKKSQIYRTIKRGNAWTRPQMPSIFRGMEKEHFGNGSFSLDKLRFYFTQCDSKGVEDAGCELYVIERNGQGWSLPQKLPGYINREGANTTTPFVTVQDGKEIIYFASDMEGGYGGMDIWYTMKDIKAKDLSFTTPENVGESVNTKRNEITPFYESATQTLYFSSNGHVNIGGYDVYKSEGGQGTWSEPKHLGMPVNSAADDMYYILMDNQKIGYLTSNRIYGDRKNVTTDDDVFRFEIDEKEIKVSGNIYELGNSSKSIESVIVSLLEVTADGRERPLNTKIFSDGTFYFSVLPDREYKIEAEKMGYTNAVYTIKTNEGRDIKQDLVLEKTAPALVVGPPGGKSRNKITPPPSADVEEDEPEETVRTQPTTPPGNNPIVEPKPKTNLDGEEKPPVTPKIVEKPKEKEKPIVQPPTKPNNVFKVIATKRFSELSRSQILSITYVDSKPYVETPEGYIEVLNDDLVDTDVNTNSIDHGDKPNSDVNDEIDDEFGGKPPVKPIEYGTVYKIQLAAVSEYKAHKFTEVEGIGDIQLEEFEERNLVRVMLVSFDNIKDAKRALVKLNERGFDRAFVQRYENGKRIGPMIRPNR